MELTTWRPSPRALITTALALIAVLLVGGGLWFWLSARAERSQATHAEALAQAQLARNPQAPPTLRPTAITALEAALAQAPNAGLAAQTAYELGGLRYDQCQYDPHARARGHRDDVGKRAEFPEGDRGVHRRARGHRQGQARAVLSRGPADRPRAQPGARGAARSGHSDLPACPEGSAEAAPRGRGSRPAGEPRGSVIRPR
jgi:hypothetical protein